MKKYSRFTLIILALVVSSFVCDKNITMHEKEPDKQSKRQVIRLGADLAIINSASAEIVNDPRLSSKKGITLKPGVTTAIDGERTESDLVFNVNLPAGRYVMSTFAVTDSEGAAQMKKATTKFESLYIKIQIDDLRPTKRVVSVPWDRPRQETGMFDLNGNTQKLRIWLPRGVRLEYVELSNYVAPKIPESASNYKPEIIPPATHPRLCINSQSLPKVKARLEMGENLAIWEQLKKSALAPFVFQFNQDKEMSYDVKLERAAETKAFYYLMTGDKKIGKEAIQLMTNYLSLVEFGNLLDITREIGRAIYTASEVYDWCYDLLTKDERKILCDNMMRLSESMEVGWPPFKQSIVTGHGNEAQINRDLLSMSIAIYNENPLPYQYCSYRILEELVPLRSWQYQSPRHNQGLNYASFRMTWELYAAMLFYRMTGRPVFDENIKNVSKHFLYMRLPDGEMLRDGDGVDGPLTENYYWSRPQIMFMFYTYANDPIIKAEYERQGGIAENPVLFLLLNDPGLKAQPSKESLPLTMDFGPVLGSMVARTGWHMGLNSNDVVAEIKGGGYIFGNHQHSDAGAIQIYYRGYQVADLGLYGFYGTPYDFNFNKRSVSHSMMLVRDPEEKFGSTESNDGGTRFNQRSPETPKEAQTDPWFNNGRIVSSDFGPSKLRPSFSYYAVDLTGAYSSKLKSYTREFCFLNLEREDIPAAIILSDNMTSANPEFKKYWQINTHKMPEITGNRIVLKNEMKGLVGKTHVEMLLPSLKECNTEVLNGTESHSSFGFKYDIPSKFIEKNFPEVNGSRIMISPKIARSQDRFLTVFQLAAGETKPLPVTRYETEVSDIIILGNRVVSINKGTELIDKGYTLKIPGKGKYQIVLTGMKPQQWNVTLRNGKKLITVNVREGKNSICFDANEGEYVISPV